MQSPTPPTITTPTTTTSTTNITPQQQTELQQRKDEFNEALTTCFSLLETSHQDYRVVKVGIQSIVELTNSIYCTNTIKDKILKLLLDIINNPLLYSKTVIRYSIKGIGVIGCQDDSLVTQTITFLAKILEFKSENYHYLKKVCFHALSRIGRKYPVYQTILLALFEKYIMSPLSGNDVICSILLAYSRLAQTNSQIRVMSMKRWLEATESPHAQLRSAGILSLGYASCPTGNIVNDKNIESLCYSKSIELLQFHKVDEVLDDEKNDPWRMESVYQVQASACKALGLLSRSSISEWLPKISKIFKTILSSNRYAAPVKAMVLLNYGQISYYLNSSSPFFSPLKTILLHLSSDDNTSISSPSCTSLTKFTLSHLLDEDTSSDSGTIFYNQVKQIIQSKLSTPIRNSKQDQIESFLKTWCKLIGKNYRPILNQCSSILSTLSSDLYDGKSQISNQLPLLKNRHLFQTPVPNFNNNGIPIQMVFNNLGGLQGLLQIVNDYQQLSILVKYFSTVVITSILAFFKKPSLFDHPQYKSALKEKITLQKLKGFSTLVPETYDELIGDLFNTSGSGSNSVLKREFFINVIFSPENLDNSSFLAKYKSGSVDPTMMTTTMLQQKSQQKETTTQQSKQPSISPTILKPADPRLSIFSKSLPLISSQQQTTTTTSSPIDSTTTAPIPSTKIQQPPVKKAATTIFSKPLSTIKPRSSGLSSISATLAAATASLANINATTSTSTPQSTTTVTSPIPTTTTLQVEEKKQSDEMIVDEKKVEEKKPTNPFSKPLPLISQQKPESPITTTSTIIIEEKKVEEKKVNPFSKPLPLISKVSPSTSPSIITTSLSVSNESKEEGEEEEEEGVEVEEKKSTNPFSKPLPLISKVSPIPSPPITTTISPSIPTTTLIVEEKKVNPFSKPLPLISKVSPIPSPPITTTTTIDTIKTTNTTISPPIATTTLLEEKKPNNPFSKPLPLINKSSPIPSPPITNTPLVAVEEKKSTNPFSKLLPLIGQPTSKVIIPPIIPVNKPPTKTTTPSPPQVNSIFSKPLPLINPKTTTAATTTTIPSTAPLKKQDIFNLPPIVNTKKPTKSLNSQSMGVKLMQGTSWQPKKPAPSQPPVAALVPTTPIINNNPFSKPLPLIGQSTTTTTTTTTPSPIESTLPIKNDELDIQTTPLLAVEEKKVNPFSKPLPLIGQSTTTTTKTTNTAPIVNKEQQQQDDDFNEMEDEEEEEKEDSDDIDKEDSDEEDSDELMIDDNTNNSFDQTLISKSNSNSKKRESSSLLLSDDSDEEDKTMNTEQKKLKLDIPGMIQTTNDNNTTDNNNNNNNNNNRGKKSKKVKKTQTESQKNRKDKKSKSNNKKNNKNFNNPSVNVETTQLYQGIDFKAKTEYVKPDPIVCTFYKIGMCKKGAECTYLHEGPVEIRKPTEVCKFFRSGVCGKGANCTFSHDLQIEACKFYNSPSGCTNAECPYGHRIVTPPLTSSSSPPQQSTTTPPLNLSSPILTGQQLQQQQQQDQQQDDQLNINKPLSLSFQMGDLFQPQ